MAHHGSSRESGEEMSQRMKEALKKVENELSHRGMPIGPTGQFPLGKLIPSDEGEIRIAIGVSQGRVVIDFGSQVTWIGFDKQQAIDVAESILAKARSLQ